MALIWLDTTSPAVRSAVVSGGWGKAPHSEHGLPVPAEGVIDPIAAALAQASERLSRLVGYSVHPAGTAVERFTPAVKPLKLPLQMMPLRLVQTVTKLDAEGDLIPVTDQWYSWVNGIQFAPRNISYGSLSWMCSAQGPWHYEVRYRFGSTVTNDARAAVLSLAHQYWLASSGCFECDACTLPDNVTSVTREGISYSMDTPTPLTGGYDKVGLAEVDRWVDGVNPKRAGARSGVWAGDVVPGVIVSLRDARPTWAV